MVQLVHLAVKGGLVSPGLLVSLVHLVLLVRRDRQGHKVPQVLKDQRETTDLPELRAPLVQMGSKDQEVIRVRPVIRVTADNLVKRVELGNKDSLGPLDLKVSLVLQVLLGLRGPLALSEVLEHPEFQAVKHLEFKEPLVALALPDLLDHKVSKDPLDLQANQVSKDHKDRRGLKDQQDLKDNKVKLGKQDPLVVLGRPELKVHREQMVQLGRREIEELSDPPVCRVTKAPLEVWVRRETKDPLDRLDSLEQPARLELLDCRAIQDRVDLQDLPDNRVNLDSKVRPVLRVSREPLVSPDLLEPLDRRASPAR